MISMWAKIKWINKSTRLSRELVIYRWKMFRKYPTIQPFSRIANLIGVCIAHGLTTCKFVSKR